MAATIAKVSAKKAKDYYYEKDPFFGEDGQEEGENGGNLNWHGVQTEMFELDKNKKVTKNEFANLLNGKDKKGEIQIKPDKNEVAAFDLTFAAPKSVSIAALSNGKNEEIIEAHKKAVKAALHYAEQNFANAKVWKDGKRVIENQKNLLVATALHSTNRNQDPHLHTHALIFNQVYNKTNNKFNALAAQELFENQKTLDNIYKTELAKNLKEMGYKIQKTGNGFELDIKQGLVDEFSSRRQEILEKAGELGKTDVKDKVHIQHLLKAEKEDISKEELLEKWEESIKTYYSDKEKMLEALKINQQQNQNEVQNQQQIQNQNGEEFSSKKEVLEIAGKLLTETEAVFTEKQILNLASNLAVGQYTYKELEKELEKVKKNGQKEDRELKFLGIEEENGEKVFTTLEMYKIEKENEEILKSQKNFEANMSYKEAVDALKAFEKENFKLNDEQFNAVVNILTSNSQFSAIQGVAGAGKTTMLKAFNYALQYKEKQIEVTLLAPTNKAAQGAKEESKVNNKEFKSETVAKHLIKISNNGMKESKTNYKNSKIDDNNFEKQNQKISHVKLEEKKITKAELYIKSGHGIFGKQKEFSLNPSNSFGIKLNKNLEASFKITKKNKIIKKTKINRGRFKGATKKEEISFSGDSVNYKSTIKFNDGSKYNTEIQNWNGANKLMAAVFNVKNTKIENKKERLKQTEINLTAAKLTLKKVDKQNASQKKVELNFAGLAKATYNKIKQQNKNNIQTQTTKSFRILGLNIQTIKEEIRDKKGNLISLKTEKTKTFAGLTLGKKIDVQNFNNKKADLKITENENNKTINQKTFKNIDAQKAIQIANKNSKIEKSEKMIIIDESSMLSAKDLNKILKNAKKTNIRVVFIGDTQQLQSIGAGRSFKQVQKHTNTTFINTSLRQHTETDKNIANNARARETIQKSFNELKNKNRIKELKNKDERLEAIAAAAVKKETLKGNKFGKEYSKEVDYKNNLVLANTRTENKELNKIIREKLKQQNVLKEEYKFKIVEQKNMSATKQSFAANFKKGQIIQTFSADQNKLKMGEEYKIDKIDKIKNTLTLLDKNNNKIEINAKEYAGKLSVSEQKSISLAQNDIVVITKTDKRQNLKNSERGIILDIDKEKQQIKVDFGDNNIKTIDLSKGNVGLDYGYSVTTYKAQGQTVDRVQVAASTSGNAKKMNNLNNFYVAVSRQKLKVEVFTDNKEKLQKQVEVDQKKSSTLDYDNNHNQLQKNNIKNKNLEKIVEKRMNQIKNNLNNQQQLKIDNQNQSQNKQNQNQIQNQSQNKQQIQNQNQKISHVKLEEKNIEK